MFDAAIFREYDIRGRAPELLSPDGRARRRPGARDADPPARRHDRARRPRRPSFVAGARGGGRVGARGVRPLGPRPRRRADAGALPRAPPRSARDGGVMVTGSHNPKSDNGLKLCLGTDSLWGDAIRSLRDEALRRRLRVGRGPHRAARRTSSATSTTSCPRFSFRRRFRVAVDCGNGVMGPVVLEAFRRLGFDVIPLFCEPDGDFPNHIPDPEVPGLHGDALRATVVVRARRRGPRVRRRRRPRRRDRRAGPQDLGRSPRRGLRRGRCSRSIPAGSIRYDVKCGDFLDDVGPLAWRRPADGEDRPLAAQEGPEGRRRDLRRRALGPPRLQSRLPADRRLALRRAAPPRARGARAAAR